MQIPFYKYQGEGNDFVLIDNRSQAYSPLTKKQINKLCNRRFGIGADGLMLLETHAKYDFTMRYFNADGREASMCGNGGRCIVAFACHLGLVEDPKHIRFEAVDGLHHAELVADQVVALQMIDVEEIKKYEDAYILDTGSPHYVTFIPLQENFDTKGEGAKIRYSPAFRKQGINVNFVTPLDEHTLCVRTYERGVEDETLACGTGCVASVLAHAYHTRSKQESFQVYVQGGQLQVSFQRVANTFSQITLQGGAVQTFQGETWLDK